jgi:hypothetical protein
MTILKLLRIFSKICIALSRKDLEGISRGLFQNYDPEIYLARLTKSPKTLFTLNTITRLVTVTQLDAIHTQRINNSYLIS